MVLDCNEKSRHTETAKTKISPIKKRTNLKTASHEIKNIPLECKESWDNVEIPSPDEKKAILKLYRKIKMMRNESYHRKSMVAHNHHEPIKNMKN